MLFKCWMHDWFFLFHPWLFFGSLYPFHFIFQMENFITPARANDLPYVRSRRWMLASGMDLRPGSSEDPDFLRGGAWPYLISRGEGTRRGAGARGRASPGSTPSLMAEAGNGAAVYRAIFHGAQTYWSASIPTLPASAAPYTLPYPYVHPVFPLPVPAFPFHSAFFATALESCVLVSPFSCRSSSFPLALVGTFTESRPLSVNMDKKHLRIAL